MTFEKKNKQLGDEIKEAEESREKVIAEIVVRVLDKILPIIDERLSATPVKSKKSKFDE